MFLKTLTSAAATFFWAIILVLTIAALAAYVDKDFRQQLRQQAAQLLFGDEVVTASEHETALRALQTTRAALAEAGQAVSDLDAQLQEQASTTNALTGEFDAARERLAEAEYGRNTLADELAASNQELEAARTALRERQQAAETQFQALREKLKKANHSQQVAIEQRQNEMTIIRVGNQVLFDSGSAALKPEGRQLLSLIADTLQQFPDRIIRVEGHTDNRPISSPGVRKHYPTNWELSAARAVSAVRFLESSAGLPPAQLLAAGMGEHHPVAPNDTPANQARNRRIEIVLMPPAARFESRTIAGP